MLLKLIMPYGAVSSGAMMYKDGDYSEFLTSLSGISLDRYKSIDQ